MFWRINLMVLVACSWGAAASAQVEVGNGGDVVRCRAAADSELAGLYMLDFVLTRGQGAPLAVAADPLARIEALVKDIPQFGLNFTMYLKDTKDQWLGELNEHRAHQWQPDTLDAFVVNDENLTSRLPDNCVEVTASGRRALIEQIVVRHWRQSYTKYFYNVSLATELSADAMQQSFLLVHEFLWYYADDAAVLRDVTRFLHSTSADGLDAEALRVELQSRGLNLRMQPEYRHRDVRVTVADDASGLTVDANELTMYWGSWLVTYTVRVHNDTPHLLRLQNFFMESLTDGCYTPSIAPGGVGEVGADANKGQYLWVSIWDHDRPPFECPPVEERDYVYIRSSVTPVP
jgi:hypothetical protein